MNTGLRYSWDDILPQGRQALLCTGTVCEPWAGCVVGASWVGRASGMVVREEEGCAQRERLSPAVLKANIKLKLN